ncbi:MAG TPA: YidC/Oxa1 family membrane protein insertase [Candidatus Saccharimonadales bacterium]|nr:YidC/Oxa1 family membrane protein insertase [Candidatus Saccharimonadales bacterium]
MFNTLLVYPLFNLLALIYAVIPGHDFGLAIIVLTVLLRLVMWPLIKKQLHSQRAMQALAPEITKVRAKAKGDKQKESQLLMELYKHKGVSPFASLAPLLVQLPILFALFVVLRDVVKAGEIARVAYEPIKQLGPIQSIIKDAASFHPSLFGFIDLAQPNLILAVLTGATQYYQTKQITPRQTNSDDPSAKAASLMTVIFPFITAGIALTLPSALALFWTVTSLVAIWQQRLILQQDVTEMKETTKP